MDPERAIEPLTRHLDQARRDFGPGASFTLLNLDMLAAAHAARGNFAIADALVREWAQNLEHTNDHPWQQMRLTYARTRLAVARGRLADARNSARSLATMPADDSSAPLPAFERHEISAQLAMASGNWTAAARAWLELADTLRKHRPRDPQKARALVAAARLHIAHGSTQSAGPLLDEAIDATSDTAPGSGLWLWPRIVTGHLDPQRLDALQAELADARVDITRPRRTTALQIYADWQWLSARMRCEAGDQRGARNARKRALEAYIKAGPAQRLMHGAAKSWSPSSECWPNLVPAALARTTGE